MTAYNVVRFRTKPGKEKSFVDFHKNAAAISGMRDGALIKTGDNTYCLVGKWDSYESIVAARPAMISMLDQFRDSLEDLGSGLGVTDAVSGKVVAELRHH